MERALLQGERQAELDQMEAEADIIGQLQQKLNELESAIQMEKDKVRVCFAPFFRWKQFDNLTGLENPVFCMFSSSTVTENSYQPLYVDFLDLSCNFWVKDYIVW